MPLDLGLTGAASVSRSGSTDAWVNPANALASDNTYASSGPLGVGDKSQWLRFEIPAPGVAFLTKPDLLTLHVECQIEPDGNDVVDVIFDDIRLGTGSTPAGTNVATSAPLPLTDGVLEYALPTDGITLSDLNAGNARLFLGVKALPETAYSVSDFDLSYNANGTEFAEATGFPTINNSWTSPTPPATFSRIVARSGGEPGGGTVFCEQDGTVQIVAETVLPWTYVIVNVNSRAAGFGDESGVSNAQSDNGIGTIPVTTYFSSESDGTANRKIRLLGGQGSLPISLYASGHNTYTDSDLPGEPGAAAEVALSANVVQPVATSALIDFVKLEAPDQGSSVLFAGHPYRRRFHRGA